MPKKKTGARKKKEKQKELQRKIQTGEAKRVDVSLLPCNVTMECSACGRRQKNRAFCYFCGSTQRMITCAECGKIKCMGAGGDCLVKHTGRNVTGMGLVGAVCDFCEAWVCHSRKCMQTHGCSCLLRNTEELDAMPVDCFECGRTVWNHGGRVFQCATCDKWLCEDDQFLHQASCQYLEDETYKCLSCNRIGQWSCLRCKIAFCDKHVYGKINALSGTKGSDPNCKRCQFQLQPTKDLSMSVRTHDYGRHAAGSSTADATGGGGGGFASISDAIAASAGARVTYSDEDDYSDDNDDDEEDEDEDEDEDEEATFGMYADRSGKGY